MKETVPSGVPNRGIYHRRKRFKAMGTPPALRAVVRSGARCAAIVEKKAVLADGSVLGRCEYHGLVELEGGLPERHTRWKPFDDTQAINALAPKKRIECLAEAMPILRVMHTRLEGFGWKRHDTVRAKHQESMILKPSMRWRRKNALNAWLRRCQFSG